MSTVANLLVEYGNAMRGDWGDIDGRSVLSDLENMAGLVDLFGNQEIPDGLVVAARYSAYLCPAGNGHWRDWCDKDCNGDEAG